ncbi:MAG TPA: hypothetical protein PLK63_10965 [Catalimonadaceae bacterium]|nr:hypothetical protein [Catalimonadaceae bacterium]
MIRPTHFFLLLTFLFSFELRAQEFTRIFLDSAIQQTANNLIVSPDQSIWLGGTKVPVGESSPVAWFYRLKKDGSLHRRIPIPAPGAQTWSGMAQLSNGQIAIVIGQKNQTDTTENWLAIADTQSIIRFEHIPELDEAILEDVLKTRSGKLIVSGFRAGPGPQGNNFFVAKVNPANAGTEWIFEESYAFTERVANVMEARDGSFIFCGDIYTTGYNPMVVKLDSNGAVIWDKIIDTQWNDGPQTLVEDSSGRIWVVGESSTSAGSLFDNELTVLSSDGQILWQQWIGSPGQDAAFLIRKATGPGFWVGGYSNAGNGGAGPIGPFLMRLGTEGNSLGEKFWSLDGPSPMYDLSISGDSVFHFCGVSNSQAYLMRRENPDLQPVFTVSVGSKMVPTEKFEWKYDKGSESFLRSEQADSRMELADLQGRILKQSARGESRLSVASLPEGVYVGIEKREDGKINARIFRK